MSTARDTLAPLELSPVTQRVARASKLLYANTAPQFVAESRKVGASFDWVCDTDDALGPKVTRLEASQPEAAVTLILQALAQA